MTREQAKQIALILLKKDIEKDGLDAISFQSPSVGKKSWTLREELIALIKDEPLEECDFNVIDSVLLTEDWHNERGQSFLDLPLYESVKNGTANTNDLLNEILTEEDKKELGL